jgi:chemotaxis signal transduction protein
MLTMIFEVGGQQMALPCAQILEVVPLVALRGISPGPRWLRGVFALRGQLVPVVDLSILLVNRPSAELLSSRIAIVRAELESKEETALGILGEKMTVVRQLRTAGAARMPAFRGSDLGPTLMQDGNPLQLLDVGALVGSLALGEVRRLALNGFQNEADRDRTQP